MRSWRPLLSTPQNLKKEIVGVDIFLDWNPRSGIQFQSAADYLAGQVSTVSGDGLDLRLITNRGVKVWPGGFPETFCTDQYGLPTCLMESHMTIVGAFVSNQKMVLLSSTVRSSRF